MASPGDDGKSGVGNELGSSASPGTEQRVLVDVSKLADILTQARGPILDRLSRQLPKLTGDGSVDVLEWLTDLERLCQVERVAPCDVIGHLLSGNAARVHRRMTVGDASQWEVVRAALVGEYALPLQEAWRQFTGVQLGADEPVDVYLDRLERLGGRLGLTSRDMAFRVKFYEGLPASVYDWAVASADAYTAVFETVVSRVRARLSARRDAAGRGRRPLSSGARPTAVGRQGGNSSVGCYRCGGSHRVRDCRKQEAVRPPAERVASGKRKKQDCFRCGKSGHFARDCTTQETAGTSAGFVGDEPGFREEGACRGDASSSMETE